VLLTTSCVSPLLHTRKQMAAKDASLPKRLGLVGVGTIGSAVVRGLCSCPDAQTQLASVVISPRGAEKAAALQKEFPDLIRIAADNQAVVDSSDCVIIAVLPKQTEEVLQQLKFRPEQSVLSLVATLSVPRLRELSAPASECAKACPLPAVARRQGATILVPPLPVGKAIFDRLGTCVTSDTEEQFSKLQVCSCFMGDFYKRQLVMQEWLVNQGVPKVSAASWVGASFTTYAADTANAGPTTFETLVHEQTPGGLNEMVWKQQDADGVYKATQRSMDAVVKRLLGATTNPSPPAPAKSTESQ